MVPPGSEAVIVTVDVPSRFGRPVILPVEELIDSPRGNPVAA